MADTRWALVVGASRGLGLGLAAELKSRGWNVVATVRDQAGEDRVKALSGKPGGSIQAEHLVNAGIAPPEGHDAASASREEAAAIFLTNAVAPIRTARAFVDRVNATTGIVAFMSSGLGSVADKTDSYSELYSASKAALNSLSRSFAASLGGKRITVLAVAPGWVRTDMGGPGAPLSVEESTRGIVDMLESRAGTGRHGFVDYQGHDVAW